MERTFELERSQPLSKSDEGFVRDFFHRLEQTSFEDEHLRKEPFALADSAPAMRKLIGWPILLTAWVQTRIFLGLDPRQHRDRHRDLAPRNKRSRCAQSVSFAKLSDMISAVHHISISVQKPVAAVYEFASNPENLPKWASGLSGVQIHKEGSVWISDSPMGRVKIQFAAKNAFGVMDHDVTIPSGETTHNAFRVIPNDDGSEVIFSAFQNKMTEDQFKKDTATIQKDLQTLKSKLEAK